MARSGAAGEGDDHRGEGLLASPVMRRVPREVRRRLDRAIIERVSGDKSLEVIIRDLNLGRYGVTRPVLKAYADAIEVVIRPVASAQVIAGVLGCLPAACRQKILASNELLMLSKVAQVLSGAGDEPMAAGELVKLASVLRSAAQELRSESGREQKDDKQESAAEPKLFDLERMGEAVRMLYNLSWPSSSEPGGGSPPPESKAPMPRE